MSESDIKGLSLEESEAQQAEDFFEQQKETSAKLYVGGLAQETTEDGLRDYFSKFGEVLSVALIRDRFTQQSRGYAFVVMKDKDTGERICAREHTIDARTVQPKFSTPSMGTRKVFVGGLSHAVTDEAFKEYFSKYGTIEDAQIIFDHKNNRPRGFGFITFAEDAAVDRALTAGTMHELGGAKCEVKRAVPRDRQYGNWQGRGGGRGGGGRFYNNGGGYQNGGRMGGHGGYYGGAPGYYGGPGQYYGPQSYGPQGYGFYGPMGGRGWGGGYPPNGGYPNGGYPNGGGYPQNGGGRGYGGRGGGRYGGRGRGGKGEPRESTSAGGSETAPAAAAPAGAAPQ